MLTVKKQTLLIPVFAALASILTLNYQNRISSEGFFSVYQGPTYTGKGWPWMYFKVYESGRTSFDFNFMILTFVFWIIVGFVFFLILQVMRYFLSKLAKFKSLSKKS